ncbi:MAG: class II aldolase/adducin family protein [Clostridiales bacterium]|nr:class II aldolase/adducin family protein [Clostridiales bacterium]
MDIKTARQEVIDAGNMLVERGLTSRTWGNVSCRIDEKSFVITPSGRPYATLTADMLVEVDIETLNHKGELKPSSEKGVHAAVYRARPEINFVIHTHQTNASAMSALGNAIKYIPSSMMPVLGSIIPYAEYGLPGTGKLSAMAGAALKNSDTRALIMSHHGALCFGEDSLKTFESASMLEEVSALQLLTQFKKIYDLEAKDLAEMARLIDAEENSKTAISGARVTSARQGDGFILETQEGESLTVNLQNGQSQGAQALADEADLHRAVYLKRPDINNIIHSYEAEILSVSNFGKNLKPQLDDFAQIVGIDCPCVLTNPANKRDFHKSCLRALKGRNAVLIKGKGALCCGANEDDSKAIEEITQKNSLAFLGTKLFNFYQPIKPLHARLMRFVYLKKYSKEAQK